MTWYWQLHHPGYVRCELLNQRPSPELRWVVRARGLTSGDRLPVKPGEHRGRKWVLRKICHQAPHRTRQLLHTRESIRWIAHCTSRRPTFLLPLINELLAPIPLRTPHAQRTTRTRERSDAVQIARGDSPVSAVVCTR